MKAGKLLIGAMCLGSTCRSPQIFGIVRHELERRGIPAQVRSFGAIDELRDGVNDRPAHLRAAQPHSITIMRERGIDITDHVPAHVSQVGVEDYDLILVADPVAYRRLTAEYGVSPDKAILLNAPDGVYNPFDQSQPDLLKQDLSRYRRTAEQLSELMPGVIEKHILPLVAQQ